MTRYSGSKGRLPVLGRYILSSIAIAALALVVGNVAAAPAAPARPPTAKPAVSPPTLPANRASAPTTAKVVPPRGGPNRPPVANAGSDRTVRADQTAPVVLDGSESADPDGDALGYTWSSKGKTLVQGPNPLHLLELPCGVHEFQLTVDDGRGGRSTAQLKVKVVKTVPVDWPQWYGTDGSGHSYETHWLENWPPVVLWIRPEITQGGYAGNSSPVVSEGRVYHCGNNGMLHCLDAATGRVLWAQKFAGSNSTPAVDEARVYTVGRDCKSVPVTCWDKVTGREIWKTTVNVEAFNADGAGYSSSPVVYGDVLFLDGTALSKFTGAVLWNRRTNERATLAKYFTWDGRTYLVDGGRLIDWVNGKDVRMLGLSTAWWLHSTATYGNDKVWLTQSLRDIRTGAVSWTTDLKLRSGAEMYLQPVVVGDMGYFIRGCHGAGGPMCAMDMKTGRELWRGPSWGTWIAVGDKLLAHGSGQVAVIRTGKAQYEEEGPAYRFTPAGSQGYPLIAYANKQFYVMANDGLTCLTTAITAPSLNNGLGATWNPAARTARLSGALVNTGGKPSQFFIHWGKTDGGTDPAQWANTISLGPGQPGEFSADTPPLERNAIYYYRCSATNAMGRGRASETLRFATPDPMNLANDTALAVRWTFDEIAGDKIADTSPNGVTAALRISRSSGLADGAIGQSLRFASNDTLTSSRLQPPLRRDFTLTLWLRVGEKYTSGRYLLRLQPAQLHLGFKESVPAVNNVPAMSALQPNRWHHLTLTHTGGHHMLYVDGAPASERIPASDDPYNQLLMRFAGEGQLDDLRVYRRALTVEEIRELAAAGAKTKS